MIITQVKRHNNTTMIKSKSVFGKRTLLYYQTRGGIYFELISALSQLKNYSRSFPQILDVLNEACFQFEVLRPMRILRLYDILGIHPLYLMLSVAALANDQKILSSEQLKIISEVASEYDIMTWNLFKKMLIADKKNLVGNQTAEDRSSQDDKVTMIQAQQIQKQRKQIQDLEEQLKAKDHQLNDALCQITKDNDKIRLLTASCEQKSEETFSFESILDFVEKRGRYKKCDQILDMLNDMFVAARDWDKVSMVSDVKHKIEGTDFKVINNHNNIYGSNVFSGVVNNPQFPLTSKNDSCNEQE